jgi:hypothetical protein
VAAVTEVVEVVHAVVAVAALATEVVVVVDLAEDEAVVEVGIWQPLIIHATVD